MKLSPVLLFLILMFCIAVTALQAAELIPAPLTAEHSLQLTAGYDTNVDLTPSKPQAGAYFSLNENSLWEHDNFPTSYTTEFDLTYSRNTPCGDSVLSFEHYREDSLSALFSHEISYTSLSDILYEAGGALEYNSIEDDSICGTTARLMGNISLVNSPEKVFIFSTDYGLTDSIDLDSGIDIRILNFSTAALLLFSDDQFIYISYKISFSKSDDPEYDYMSIGPALVLSFPYNNHSYSATISYLEYFYQSIPEENLLSVSVEGTHPLSSSLLLIWEYTYNVSNSQDNPKRFRQHLFLVGLRVLL